eukprot:scaffold5.g719.t1
MYSGLRSVALGALGSGAAAGAAASLSPAYAVLRGAARPTSPLAQRAAAALALGGLAEGLLRSAAGFAEAQLLATEAEAALLAVCEVADAEAPPQAAAGPPPLPAAAAAVDGSSSSSFLVDACALATVQLAEGARRPAPTPAMRRCHARALLHGALSLQPFCGAAAAGQPPAAASKALRLQLDSALGQHVAGLARGLADGYPAASPAEQAWLLGQLVSTAQQTGDLYAAYSLNTPAEWMQAVDAAVLRQLLDRTFLCALALLDAAWRATARNAALRPGCGLDGGEPPHMAAATTAAGIAGVLADLQFCRLRSETYSALLRGVLSALPGAPAGVAALAAHLPCYADLAAAVPARGGAPRWAIDGVAAAKVQFLFTLLGPCAGHLPEEAVAGRVAPLMFLYLLHPHRPASAAAHQLFCALVTAAPPAQRERLAPYYVMRCLEGFPGATPVAQLAAGLAAAVQALLPGSLVPLVCLERVLVRCRELVVGSDPGRQSAATELCGAAAQALLAVPHALLDGAVALFDDALGGLPPEAQLALAPALYAAISHSDDCVRKPELAAWYQARVAAAGAAAARQRKAQLVDTTGAALVAHCRAALALTCKAALREMEADAGAWHPSVEAHTSAGAVSLLQWLRKHKPQLEDDGITRDTLRQLLSVEGRHAAVLEAIVPCAGCLSILNLHCFKLDHVPAAFSGLTRLRCLSLGDCGTPDIDLPAYIDLPASLAALTQLCELVTVGCNVGGGWEHVPPSVTRLTASLHLEAAPAALPPALAQLTHLRRLELGSVEDNDLTYLPASLTALSLVLLGGEDEGAEEGPAFSAGLHVAPHRAAQLQVDLLLELSLSESWVACRLGSLPPSLGALDLSHVDCEIKCLPDLSAPLPDLLDLDLGCNCLKELPPLPQQLTRLILHGNPLLVLPFVPPSLAELDVVSCSLLLANLRGATGLQTLSVACNPWLACGGLFPPAHLAGRLGGLVLEAVQPVPFMRRVPPSQLRMLGLLQAYPNLYVSIAQPALDPACPGAARSMLAGLGQHFGSQADAE